MLDFPMAKANLRLNALDTFFDFAPRKIFTKAQIHREQNGVRPEVHGENALDPFDGGVGLHQAPSPMSKPLVSVGAFYGDEAFHRDEQRNRFKNKREP